MEKLENDAHGFPPVAGALGFASPVEGDAIYADFAFIRLVEGPQKVEQGAFATAAGAGDGGHGARGEVKGKLTESVDGATTALMVSAADVAEMDHAGEVGPCQAGSGCAVSIPP